MIDPQHVAAAGRALQPAAPPGEVFLFVGVPVVDRIPPQLARFGEIIGGHARDHVRDPRLVQLEQLPMGPYVRAVVGDVDGDIADEVHALFVGVGPEGLPLGVETVLDEGVVVDQVPELFSIPGHGLRLMIPDILWPVHPALALEPILQGAEQGPILEIPAVLRHVVGHPGPIEPGEGLLEHLAAAIIQKAEIHLPGIVAPIRADIRIGQKPLLLQQVQIHQVGVPGESGRALIGGIPIAGGRQGQDLPIPLPRTMQIIHEIIGCLAQCAYAVGGWQAGDMQQQAARSFHVLSSRSL